MPFDRFGVIIRRLYTDDVPIVAFCAAGIVIRALAAALQDKRAEPPVLAVAEDGSAVVPLLGGVRGVNALARTIGEVLGTRPAITTSGAVRVGATLEHPPHGYELCNPAAGKRIMSDLLAAHKAVGRGALPARDPLAVRPQRKARHHCQPARPRAGRRRIGVSSAVRCGGHCRRRGGPARSRPGFARPPRPRGACSWGDCHVTAESDIAREGWRRGCRWRGRACRDR
jgi:Cobalamin synthesis G N-terminal